MASPIPPPLFLPSPGHPPIPWSDWKLIFQAYADAAGKDATKPERLKALLQNALGYAVLKLFCTLNAASASASMTANFLLRGHKALILRSAGRANMAPRLLCFNAAFMARFHSLSAAVEMATPCRQILHFLNNTEVLARVRTFPLIYFPCSSSSCACSGCTCSVCTAFYSVCL
ncbi:hypothetical protein HPB52_021388 [Rhipicephalus sanguineus]|uniref:Uncharacterized protein n=1 Tax=Rhipicephalus sanguineus TaxID=34632 RepID=A0A9D4PMY7_RHISA|nr:hypothetical protein HPB52_021388 [Rhipicephalus sanguineus]